MASGMNMQYHIPILLMVLFFGTQSEGSINCNFEDDMCGWEQLTSDEFDWTRFSGATPSQPTGPDYDHTKGNANGFYMYTEAGYLWPPLVAGDDAVMRAPYPNQLHSTDIDLCFGFWYHLYGINIGSLNVYFTTSDTSVPASDVVWSRSGEKGNFWIQAEIRVTSFISSSRTGYFAFQGVMTDGYFGDIAVDDITFGACTKSINCDFEDGMCGWEQLTSDEFDWTRWSGATPTLPTGPDYDHTKGNANGFYMYTEAGYMWPPHLAGDDAIMRAPYPIQLLSTDIDLCFGFWYHLYGINIGSLNVYFTTSDTSVPTSDVVWSRSGEKGNFWIQAEIRVTSFISSSMTGYFAFQGVMTDGYFGDIAVDDVTLGACTSQPTTTQPITTTLLPTTTDATTTRTTTSPSTTTKATTTSLPTTKVATTTKATTTSPTTTKPTTTQPPTTTDATTTKATTTSLTTTAATTTQPTTTTDATTTKATTTSPTTTAATTTQPPTTTDATTIKATTTSLPTTTDATTTKATTAPQTTTKATTTQPPTTDTTTTKATTTPTTTKATTTSPPTTIDATTTEATTNLQTTTNAITTQAPTTTDTTTTKATTTSPTTTKATTTSPHTTTDATTTEATTTLQTTTKATTTQAPTTTDASTTKVTTNPPTTTKSITTQPDTTTDATTIEVTTISPTTTKATTTQPPKTTDDTTTKATTIGPTTTPATTTIPETTTDSTTLIVTTKPLASTTQTTTEATTREETTTSPATTTDATTTDATTTMLTTTSATTLPTTTDATSTATTEYQTTAANDDCSQSNIGRRFVVAFPKNRETGAEINSLHITTSSFQTVNVVVNEFNGNTLTDTVTNSVILSFDLSDDSRCTGDGPQNCSVKISADGDISVMGYSESGVSIGTFLAIPVDSLGDEYVVASYAPASNYYSEFTVTAADITTQVSVEFTPTVKQDRVSNGLSENLQFQLNAGQTYQVRSALDLTGSRVTSSAPVSVISGTSCANVPSDVLYCDYVVEQMPPVNTLGRSFTVASYHARPDSGITYRVIATRDNTQITSDFGNANLQAFEFYDNDVLPQASTLESFTIDSSEPVLVVQYQKGIYVDYIGDPSMSIVPSTSQFTVGEVTFPVVDSFASSNYISIVVGTANEDGIELDGIAVDSSIANRTNTLLTTVWSTDIVEGLHTVRHTDPDIPFSVLVYGHDYYKGYATLASASLAPSYCREATTQSVTTDSSTTESVTTDSSTTDSDPIADGSSSGTSFAFAFPTNRDNRPSTETYLIFTTTSPGTVSVVVTGEQFSSSFSMDASAPHTLRLEPIPLSVGSGIQESTVVIEASDEVSVQGRSVDGISLEEFTPLSNTGLGTEYVIASYPPLVSYGYQSQFTLTTGDAASTSITIRFAQSYEYEGETYNRLRPLQMDLTSHQTVQFQSLTDLTSSTISSTQPVSVVSGDSCAQIPVGVEFCNYMVEQLPPVERWGRTVVLSSYHGRTSGTIVRIIVSWTGANVNIISGLAITKSFSSATATYLDFDIGHNTDPITITADNPILVLMYHKSVYTDFVGDPAMSIVPAVEQWTSGAVTFDVIDQQSTQAADHISITIETSNEAGIALDGVLVTTINDVQTLSHGGYTIIRMNVDPGYHTVQHQDASVRFSVLVYGTNIYNSYAYPARMDLPLTNSILTEKIVH